MILVVCPNPSVDTFIYFNKFLPGKSNRILNEKRYPGGKGIHVAFALRELGEDVVVLSFWGGENGNWIKENCIGSGIKCVGPQIEESNRFCYTFRTDDHFNETEILGKGPNIDLLMYDNFIHELKEILPETEMVVISGSLPPGCPTDLYQNIQKIAAEEKISLFMDCIDEPFRLAIQYFCDGIHLNHSEFIELFSANNPEQAVKILATKCNYAAITDGKNGLYLASKNKLVHAYLHLKTVYSSVGSGDCLLAGLVTAKIRGYTISEMARLGVACGAAKCINNELGLIHIQDVLDLSPKVNIEIID